MCLRCSIVRGLTWLLLVSLPSSQIGCGTVRFSGALNSSNVQVAAGTVSFAQFTTILDGKGTNINVTIVTLLVPPGTNTFTFCGNQASQFTMNSAVQVSFTTSQACSNLITVVPR